MQCFPISHIIFHNVFYFSLMYFGYEYGRKLSGTIAKRLPRTMYLSTFNFFCLTGGMWSHSCWFGNPITETPDMFLLKLIGCRIFADVWFYSLHRLFHSPGLYQFHKIHHEYVHPISFATFYAHPLENIVCNLMTVLIPAHFLQTSHWLISFWIMLVVLSSVISHSGEIVFQGISLHSDHDQHHKYFTCFFGNGLFMDRLFRSRQVYP